MLNKLQVRPEPMMGRAHRLCQSQEVSATLSLTDSLAEQALLDSLIDEAKPPVPAHCAHMHYLLYTPFRYPSLSGGSRFASRMQSSVLYASRQANTCMAEVAFHRFRWWHDMATPPPNAVNSGHTLFEFSYRTDAGVDLSSYEHADIAPILADPHKYDDTQVLGQSLREQGAQVLIYPSARCANGGRSIAVFSPLAIHSTAPEMRQAVICHSRGDIVFFSLHDRSYEYSLESYLVDGALPKLT